MHDTGPIGFTYRELLLTNVMHYRVRDRMRIVSSPWMHRDTGWFIEDDQMRVLKEDLKWKV
jgi:hypothetical protein